jgi:hypothetical protein
MGRAERPRGSAAFEEILTAEIVILHSKTICELENIGPRI